MDGECGEKTAATIVWRGAWGFIEGTAGEGFIAVECVTSPALGARQVLQLWIWRKRAAAVP
jgi:hypothetical protein